MADLAQELGRKMPFSAEAEQSVLGSILIDPESFTKIPAIISEQDFYLDEHRKIYAAMQKLFLENRSIDPVTLMDALVHEGVYDHDEAQRYIRLIAEIVPTAANILEYARIVRDQSQLRSLITACGEISDNAFSQNDKASVIIGDAEQRIFELAQGKDTREFEHIKDVLHSTLANLKVIQNEGIDSMTVKTGFSGLDDLLVGMGNSDLVLVGARPGMGKTSFTLNVATQVARNFANREDDKDKCVCIFSLEMSNEQLVTRLLSSEALVDSKSLRSGKLSQDDWKKLAEAAMLLSKTNIYVDDTTDLTITGMKAKLRRMRNLGLVVIDYLQLMKSDRRIDNRVNEVADISRNLKIMAKELNVPVITCAQLSRGPEENGKGRRPVLSDLRDSGAIEQDADIVMFLFREGYYNETPENKDLVEVIVAKNRHGGTGTAEMNWIGQFTKFTTRELRDDAPPM